MAFRIPRGTADVLPGEVELWEYVERISKDVCGQFNYQEIRTPIFEHTELFQRGVGETTDIVEKEMYTFSDKKGRSLTLRPEGTASVARAFVENKLYASTDPVKLFYIGPMFRYERPQSGRTRQFTQVGVEAFGSKDPSLDAEVIAMAMTKFERMGLKELRLELNSVGCSTCRPAHRDKLVEHLHEVRNELCTDCQSRLEKNPLRVLDCKNETCQNLTKEAPTITEHLCEDCSTHFQDVKKYLDVMGIKYTENPRLVRGLDYYTQTAFEIISEGIGAIGTICGGGRYNGLVAEIGDNDVPGIGYAYSLERVTLALKSSGVTLDIEKGLDAYLILLGEQARLVGSKLLNDLRNNYISADMDYLDRKMKAQIKAADRLKAKYTIILGEDEIAKGVAVIRNMENGEQEEIKFDTVSDYLADRLNKNK